MKKTPEFLPSVMALHDQYDAFIIDLWGVIHDGQELYQGVRESLSALREKGKKIIFLSNAPYRATRVAGLLHGLGINNSLYDAIVTSGEVAWQSLAFPEKHTFFTPRGKRYFYMGIKEDLWLTENRHYTETGHIENADFILILDYHPHYQSREEITALLEKAVSHTIPLVCVNPDKQIVTLSGDIIYCAGIIAEQYGDMGGEVIYFGKPYPAAYAFALGLLQDSAANRILAIGDGLETDIKGANAHHLASVLVTGGIAKQHVGEPGSGDYPQKCTALFEKEQIFPDFVLGGFGQ